MTPAFLTHISGCRLRVDRAGLGCVCGDEAADGVGLEDGSSRGEQERELAVGVHLFGERGRGGGGIVSVACLRVFFS